MAYGVQNYPNIDTTDAASYPDGQVKDDSGTGDGTPFNRLTNGDYIQFFRRLLADANMPANNLPDRVGGGHIQQYYDAFRSLANTDYVVESRTSIDGDTINFQKSRTVEYSATPASGIALTIDFSMAYPGKKVLLLTNLSGSGTLNLTYINNGVSTVRRVQLSQSAISGFGTAAIQLEYKGARTGGTPELIFTLNLFAS